MCTKVVSVGHQVQRLRWPLWMRRVVRHHATGMPTLSSSVTRLDTGELGKLRTKLKAGSPRATAACTSLRNVIEGRVEGHFYTDGWPEFTTVVFQCLQPRLSDVCDLHCYTTSKQHLHRVLEQARLVTKDQWQFIQIVEDDDNSATDYLGQNIQPDGIAGLSKDDCTIYESEMFALLGKLPATSAKCPVGYRLGELAVEHTTLVSSQAGTWIASIGRPLSVVEKYLKECIQRLGSAAAYCESDPTTPVAWIMQFGFSGEMSNIFTLEEHRRKGLGAALKRALCEKQLSQGDRPFSVVASGSYTSRPSWQSKLAFQHVARMKEVCLC